MVELLRPHLVALAVGLVIGFERERRHPGRASAVGLRTTALAALAGSLAARFDPLVQAVVLGGLVAFAVVSFLTASDDERGLTSEVTLVVVGLLGALALSHESVTVALGVIVAVVLSEKERLHRFADVVTQVELEDALKLFVAAFVVLPLLPDRRFGPDGAIDPQRIWRLVVLITAIGLVGYVATRVLGPGRGLLVAGAAGGFVSAAATTASMGRVGRDPELAASSLAAALMASVATLVQLVIVVGLASEELVRRVLPGAVAGALVLAGEAWLLVRGEHGDVAEPPAEHRGRRAFQLWPALVLAGVLTGVLVAEAWLRSRVGTGAVVAAAAVAGAADVHAVAAATATLVATDELGARTAMTALVAALAVNTGSKVVLAFVSGGARWGRRFALRLVVPVAAVAAGLLVG